MRIVSLGPVAVVLFAAAIEAQGDVIEFLDRKDEWIAAVGPFTTVDFTGFPHGTFITDQHADVGVLFTDWNDSIFVNNNGFPNDGAGLDGNGDINVVFDTLQAWIAVDFPGAMRFELFRDGVLIFASTSLFAGSAGHFFGLRSSEFFDAARIIDPFGEAEIDDLHFGVMPCPADLDGDRTVAVPDLLALLAAWGTSPGGPPDFDGDGSVAVPDLLSLLSSWGPCPSPPEPCPGDFDVDWSVDDPDLTLLIEGWGTSPGGPPDVDGDGIVAVPDLLLLLGNWGVCP